MAKPAGRVAVGTGASGTDSAADESFATIGEVRLLLSSPSDVARLARTIELTRTATAHNLNARSSRSHCL
eukprot:2163519-Prymnesium_polylepis.1